MIFSPIQIANLNVLNRIAVAPMCQYSSVDGAMTDWHTQHLMQLGYSGAGLIMIEATAVERIGRITHHCVGLYNDFCERSIKKNFRTSKVSFSKKNCLWYSTSPCWKKGVNTKTMGRKKKSFQRRGSLVY
jgi:hypothetical protein